MTEPVRDTILEYDFINIIDIISALFRGETPEKARFVKGFSVYEYPIIDARRYLKEVKYFEDGREMSRKYVSKITIMLDEETILVWKDNIHSEDQLLGIIERGPIE